MDFLRRLHPHHAEAPGAVRPDLGTWRVAGPPRRDPDHTRPPPAAAAAQEGADRVAVPAAAGAAVVAVVGTRAAPQAATLPARAPASPVPAATAATAAPARSREPAAALQRAAAAEPGAAVPSSPLRRAATAGELRAVAVVAQAPGQPIEVERGAAGAFAADPSPAGRARASPALLRPAPNPSLQAPLRTEVQALQRAPGPAAPTIVQVTIDRIDLRVPSGRVAAEAPRRARPAPAVALADYLREREGGRR